MPREREDPDELNFGELPSMDDMLEIADEYRKREIEEGLTDLDFQRDDTDWDGYASQWRLR